MKKLVAFFLIFFILFNILPVTSQAMNSLTNFTKVRVYQNGQFNDVADQWYAPYVQLAYEYGLVNGTSPTSFSPEKNLTIAEAIKLASCLHSIYYTGLADFRNGTPWYEPYVDYAMQNNIIPKPFDDYNAYATRADFATIFMSALPEEALSKKNEIDDNAIPDVTIGMPFASAVYKLYRAGVLTGSDSAGTFYPHSNITRDAVAAIATRMAIPAYRQTLSLSVNELTAAEIADNSLPAVFYIEVYDYQDNCMGTASGFFISSSGLAVTNYHVIEGAASAKIQTKDGKVYQVAGVYDFNREYDLALLQIDGTGFPYLNIGNSDTVVTGATIYAVGYPWGIDQTFSKGVVTNASHLIDNISCLLIDAAISPGSSGGALINSAGQVVGVTSGGYPNAQNVNYAIPINLLQELKCTTIAPMNLIGMGAVVTASQNEVTLTIDKTATITLADVNHVALKLGTKIEDPSIVSCSFGKWNAASIPLNIKALKQGSTTITVYLMGSMNRIMAATVIRVSVILNDPPPDVSSGTTVYYEGYSPVPDWGSFTGTPVYSKLTHDDGGISYCYRLRDVSVSEKIAVTGYTYLLEENGFEFIKTIDDQGYPINLYTDGVWVVFFGLTELNGIYCYILLITPIENLQG